MSPSETLRASILEILAWDGHDHSEDADQILSALLNKLPEKKPENWTGSWSYKDGWDGYEAELRQILEEK